MIEENNKKRVAFYTLGCKVNQYETDLMKKAFKDRGYIICELEDMADICVVNSCSVTNLSTRKTRQHLSRAKKTGGIVVLAGCYAQEIDKDEKLQNVDIIIGNEEKNNIVDIVEDYIKNNISEDKEKLKKDDLSLNDTLYKVTKISDVKRYSQENALSVGQEVRESIKIEDGCNNFCSYCIIPYVRGRVRSRNLDDILSEVKSLADHGVGEVVLVGIEIASYGKDLSDDVNLVDVIEKVAQISNLKRIRLGSLEPRILTEENIKRLASIKKLCPHFHLSVQSLDNDVLKRMNRKYTREDIFKIVDNLKEAFPSVAITCDIIVGFPGETDEEFKNTLEGVKRIAFYEAHVFKYSKRKWTVASKMENQVDGNVAQKRSETLIALAQKLKNEYMESFLKKNLKVLVESKDDNYVYGYTKNYIMVKIKNNDKDLIGKEISVKLEKIQDDNMIGTI